MAALNRVSVACRPATVGQPIHETEKEAEDRERERMEWVLAERSRPSISKYLGSNVAVRSFN